MRPEAECDDVDLDAYVHRQCDEDQRNLVERHLLICDGCRIAVAEILAPDSPTRGPTVLPPGTEIDEYTIVELAGVGGMGLVYRARDAGLERDVALKFIRPSVAGDHDEATHQRHTRLDDEAKVLARLRHPNVVAVYGLGRVGDAPYIAMEFVQGCTLRRWLADRPRAQPEIRRLFTGLIDGLQAAHDAGFIHRDLKPANIIVDDNGTPRIVDVGLAGTARAINAGSPGTVAGSAGYMAPEQRRGHAVGPAADQYALTVVLYEALFGELPSTPVCVPHRSTDGRRVPARLRAAMGRGLATDPELRLACLAPLRAALAPTRRRTAAFAVAVGLAVAGIGASLYPGSTHDCTVDPPRLQALSAAVRGSDRAAQRFVEDWRETYQGLCDAFFSQRAFDLATYQTRISCLEDVAGRFEASRRPGVASVELDPPDLTRCLRWSTDIAATASRYGTAPRVQALRDAMSRFDPAGVEVEARALLNIATAVDDPALEAFARKYLAWAASAGGRFEVAQRELERAARCVAGTGRPRLEASLWVEAAAVIGLSQGHYADALPHLGRAEHLLQTDHAMASEHAAMLHQTRGMIRARQGDDADALRDLTHALALLEQLEGSEGPDLAPILSEIADLRLRDGPVFHLASAEEALRRARQLARGHQPDGSVDEAVVLAVLAEHAVLRGKLEEALEFARQAVAMATAQLGQDQTDTWIFRIAQARLEALAGARGDARLAGEGLRRATQALGVLEERLGPEHPAVARARVTHARALFAAGHCEQAELALVHGREAHSADWDASLTEERRFGRLEAACRTTLRVSSPPSSTLRAPAAG